MARFALLFLVWVARALGRPLPAPENLVTDDVRGWAWVPSTCKCVLPFPGMNPAFPMDLSRTGTMEVNFLNSKDFEHSKTAARSDGRSIWSGFTLCGKFQGHLLGQSEVNTVALPDLCSAATHPLTGIQRFPACYLAIVANK